MTMGLALLLLIGGFVFGLLYDLPSRRTKKPVGTLRIDSSDPDGPYLFLELRTDVEFVKQQKQVMVDVNIESYISQD